MILPNNNISIIDVRNALGCPSTDLGTLCSKAKTGGSGGFAFQIKENGFTAKDGHLISGAEPYFNIYSANAPAYWNVVGQELRYSLKRDSSKNYCFSLGGFRAYNHEAVKPYLFREGDTIIMQNPNISQYGGVTIFWNFGEIDWESLIGSFDAIRIYGDSQLYAARPVIDKVVSISDYNQLGHYTIDCYSNDFAGIMTGSKFYFWGDFYSGTAKICNFPTTSFGIIKWLDNWKNNLLGNISVVYKQTPNFVTASNYSISRAVLDSTSSKLQFNVTKTGEDLYTYNIKKCYIRCKWRDKTIWQDCPAYNIELPPAINLTRTCYATLPLRDDKEEYIDIQLVLE